MKTLIVLAISACACFAQANPVPASPTLTVTGPANAAAGDVADLLTVTLTGTSGANISDLGFALVLPAGITITPGVEIDAPANMTALGKALFNNLNVFLLAGLFQNLPTDTPIISDGPVAQIPVNIDNNVSGPVSISLANVGAADVNANAVPIASGPALSLTIGPSACDANGDGKVTVDDAQAVANAYTGKSPTCGLAAGCTLATLVQVINAAAGHSCLIPHK